MPNAPQCTSYDELTSAAGVQNSPLYNFENYPYFHGLDTDFFKITLEAIISIWMVREGIHLLKTLQINEI